METELTSLTLETPKVGRDELETGISALDSPNGNVGLVSENGALVTVVTVEVRVSVGVRDAEVEGESDAIAADDVTGVDRENPELGT